MRSAAASAQACTSPACQQYPVKPQVTSGSISASVLYVGSKFYPVACPIVWVLMHRDSALLHKDLEYFCIELPVPCTEGITAGWDKL